jgi:hypothetical protein
MSLYEELLEHDLNPFILFDSNGKMKNFNGEAEFLFNFVSPKELFDLALSYASQSYGFKKEFININYEKQSFYAILVGYITEDEIALRLYKEVSVAEPVKIDDSFTQTNIYTLIELSKNTSLLGSNLKIEEIYDVSIPDTKMNVNDFLITLNTIFERLTSHKTLQLKVSIKTGEYEIIDEKKCKIVKIEFDCEKKVELPNPKYMCGKNTLIHVTAKNNKIKLELPLIL